MGDNDAHGPVSVVSAHAQEQTVLLRMASSTSSQRQVQEDRYCRFSGRFVVPRMTPTIRTRSKI